MQTLVISKAITATFLLGLVSLSGCDNRKQNDTQGQKTIADSNTTTSVKVNDNNITDEKLCVTPNVKGYDKVGCIHDGLAGVMRVTHTQNDRIAKVGYVNAEGEVVIPVEYDAIYSEVWVGEGSFNDFSEGMVAVHKDNKWGFLDTTGDVVIPLEYARASNFSDGLAIVENLDYEQGAINKSDEIIIPFEKYLYLGGFNQGVSVAMISSSDPQDPQSLYGVIDKSNQVVVPFIYQKMGGLSEGLIAVSLGDKWGYINLKNKAVIPIEMPYLKVGDFSDGVAAVFDFKSGSVDEIEYGYIDKKGEVIIPIQYPLPYEWFEDGTINFKDGIAIVHKNENSTYCIDKRANTVQCPNPDDDTQSSQNIDNVYAENRTDKGVDSGLNQDMQNIEVGLSDNIYFITERLMIPMGTNKAWQWDAFEALPNDGTYQQNANNEYSEDKNEYTLSRGIVGNKSIELKGSAVAPEVIMFNSGYGEGDELWQLSQILNTQHITQLDSNCNLKDISIGGGESEGDSGDTLEYQNFYQWQEEGKQPLFIAESKGHGYVLTSVFNAYNWKNYTIVRDPQLFNKYKVWNSLSDGQEVECYFNPTKAKN